MTRPRSNPTTVQARTESAYVFARARPGADLTRCFDRLSVADGVCYCDAVAGDWEFVLLLQAPDRRSVERLARTQLGPGEIEAFEIHYSERPWLSGDLESFIRTYERMQVLEREPEPRRDRRNRTPLSAHAVVEFDSSYLASIYTRFFLDENVVHCDVTDGCRAAMLLVQARTPEEMEQALARLRVQPGVLRSSTLRIISSPGERPGPHDEWRGAEP